MSIQGPLLPKGLASSLELPSLRNLFIVCPSGIPQSEEESALVEWIQRFGGALTEITFEYSSLTESALLYCLEQLANVVTLRMVATGSVLQRVGSLRSRDRGRGPAFLSDTILSKLTPKSKSSPDAQGEGEASYCPLLENFSCRMMDIECTEQGLLDFIAERRQKNITSRLKRIVVYFNKAYEPKINARRELKARGVDIDGLLMVFKCKKARLVPTPISEMQDFLHPSDNIIADDRWMRGFDDRYAFNMHV